MIDWFYQNVPYMQLIAGRWNVIGLAWFGFSVLTLMIYIDVKTGRVIFDFKNNGRREVFNFVNSFSITYLVMLLNDELLNFTAILGGMNGIYGYPYESFDWLKYIGIRGINYFALMCCVYIIIHWGVKILFKVSFPSLLITVLIMLKNFHLVFNKLPDYASLQGAERLSVFWSHYPYGFILYYLLILSFMEKMK